MGLEGVLHEWYGCRMETGRQRGRGDECVGMMGNGNRGTRDATPCIDDDASTPCHCCKQQMTSLALARGFFVYFISFKISSYSPSPCEEGGIT